MATASFERDADVMRDMGYNAAELDALVKAAGDDMGAELLNQGGRRVDASVRAFWMSVEGPLTAQPDAVAVLRRSLRRSLG